MLGLSWVQSNSLSGILEYHRASRSFQELWIGLHLISSRSTGLWEPMPPSDVQRQGKLSLIWRKMTDRSPPGNRLLFIRWPSSIPSGRVIVGLLLPTKSSCGLEYWFWNFSETGWFCRWAPRCSAEDYHGRGRRNGEKVRGGYRYMERNDDQGMYMIALLPPVFFREGNS